MKRLIRETRFLASSLSRVSPVNHARYLSESPRTNTFPRNRDAWTTKCPPAASRRSPTTRLRDNRISDRARRRTDGPPLQRNSLRIINRGRVNVQTLVTTKVTLHTFPFRCWPHSDWREQRGIAHRKRSILNNIYLKPVTNVYRATSYEKIPSMSTSYLFVHILGKLLLLCKLNS